ncbi:MAG: DUF599 family protein [Desulforhopalus sp.]
MPIITLQEVLLVVPSVVIMVTYRLYLFIRVRRCPLKTAIGITNHARKMWVEGIRENGHDILAGTC